MASQYAAYRMVDGRTALSAEYFNRIWRDLDLRLAGLERFAPDYSAAVADLRAFGLARLEGALAPALAQLQDDLATTQALLSQLPGGVALQRDLDPPTSAQYDYAGDGRLIGVSLILPDGSVEEQALVYDDDGALVQVVTDRGARRRVTSYTWADGTLTSVFAGEPPNVLGSYESLADYYPTPLEGASIIAVYPPEPLNFTSALAQPPGVVAVRHEVAVTPGETLRLTAAMNTEGTANPGVIALRFRRDPDNGWFGASGASLAAGLGWTTLGVTVTVPAEAAYLQCYTECAEGVLLSAQPSVRRGVI
ncbi:MAG: hypothetical protein EOM91_12505 [Sphingobacteriia bacterium]|nr:hypothetical protein [Sphingobacteriia bacterium]